MNSKIAGRTCSSHLEGNIAWRHPENAIAQRERLKQERLVARERRVEPVSEGQEAEEMIHEEAANAAVSDCEGVEEEETMGMSM